VAAKRPYAKLAEAELRAQVLGRLDGRLPPPEEAKALLDEWVLRRAVEYGGRSRPESVERAGSPPGSNHGPLHT
jgi:hypothetical protein